jgi:hypothetical protein
LSRACCDTCNKRACHILFNEDRAGNKGKRRENSFCKREARCMRTLMCAPVFCRVALMTAPP